MEPPTLLGMPTATVEAIAGLFTAVAAAATAVIAFCGLRTWRDEMVGRRKAELAEEVLADFYRVRDMIVWVRSPLASTAEAANRPPEENEDEKLAQRLDTYYVPIARLQRQGEFLGAFQAKRHRFQAVFGAEAATPFDTVKAVLARVETAAQGLADMTRTGEWDKDLRREFKRRIWGENDDEMAREIDDTVRRIEKICRPAIEARERRRWCSW